MRRRIWAAIALGALIGGCVSAPEPPPRVQRPVVVRAPQPVRPSGPPAGLSQSLAMLGSTFQGRIGIAVTSVRDGWNVQWNGEARLPQQSVSKLWVALAVLDMKDQGRLRLEDAVTVGPDDLTVFHQPIAALVKRDGVYQTTVGDLLDRAMTASDNTANDRLLRYVGGPEAVRSMLARKNVLNIRFGPGERLLQAGTAGLTWRQDYASGNNFTQARAKLSPEARLSAFERYLMDPPDGATATAIAAAMARLQRGELLSRTSTAYLISTMQSSRTGKERLRGAVPMGWQFGHKTGTGQNLGGRVAGYNDVGILTAPDGRSYGVAVLMGDTSRTIPERQQLMQSVVSAIVVNHRPYG